MNTHPSRALAFLAASACLAFPAAVLAAPQVIATCQVITQPGSYVVGKNLVAAGDCLVIANDFVTIDLNGFTLSGGAKSGAGVSELPGSSFRGITVRNGVVTNFLQGILFAKSTGVTIERVNATANTAEGIVAGDMSTVNRSQAIGNGNTGIRLGQRALATGNSANENGGGGILVDIGGNVVGNSAGRNKGTGIATSEGANVAHNVSRNNGTDGIFADCPSAIVENAATNNLAQNIHVLSGACITEHNADL